MQDLAKYLERCASLGGGRGGGRGIGGGGGFNQQQYQQQVSQFTLKNIMAKYAKSQVDSRLTLGGFLSYYRDQAQWQAKTVWHDLGASGFGNDLKRRRRKEEGEEEEEVEEGGSEGGKEKGGRVELPMKSRLALGMLAFYVPMVEVLREEVVAILRRVAREDMVTSRCLIGQMLAELQRSYPPLPPPLSPSPSAAMPSVSSPLQPPPVPPSSFSSSSSSSLHIPPSSSAIACFLCALINIKDSLEGERLSEVLWGEGEGIFAVALARFDAFAARGREGGGARSQRQMLVMGQVFFRNHIEPILKELLRECPSVSRGMSEIMGREEDFARLSQMVNEKGGGGRAGGGRGRGEGRESGIGGEVRRGGGRMGGMVRGYGGGQGRERDENLGGEDEDEDEEEEEEGGFEELSENDDDEEEDDGGDDESFPYDLPPREIRVMDAGVPEVN
eukprot:evm.model.NODE_27169_length_92994_cov_27.080458.33